MRTAILVAVVLIVVAGLTMVQARRSQPDIQELASQLDKDGRIRPEAPVLRIVRTLKLVTAQAYSTAECRKENRIWRGSTTAVVVVPVRYSYGVDLAKTQTSMLDLKIAERELVMTLPAPQRLAVEVDGGHPVREDVNVTGLRFRSRAGEFWLGQARIGVYEVAQNQQLAPDKLEEIRNLTAWQIERLLTEQLRRHNIKVNVRWKE